MNTKLKKSALLLALVVCVCNPLRAQKSTPISRNPVKDVASARSNLFVLPEGDTNFYFRADLPGDNFLTIQFKRLSYWPEGSLQDVVAVASTAWKAVKDSFVSVTSSRKLAVHLPPSGFPVVASTSEWGAGERTLLLKGTRAQPLRIAVDTIVVLKTLPLSGADTGRSRLIQYTFLLKDLSEIEGIASSHALIGNVSQTFDSLVAATRNRWKRPDARYHALEAQYDVRNGINRAPVLRANRTGSLLDNFEYNAELGSSFIAGTIAGTASLRLSYYTRPKGPAAKGFVALSLSSIGFASERDDKLTLRGLSFANFEIGSVFSGASGRIPLYQTSVGFGYRIASQNEGPYKFRYRLFFNYSVSKAITVTPEFYAIPRADDEKEGAAFYGLSASVRLF